MRLTLFVGGNLELKQKGADGKVHLVSARAMIVGDRMFVRADHPVFTSDRLTRHEIGHDMIDKGEINPDDVRERIDRTFGKEKAGQLAESYAEGYADSGLSPEEIWDELICDSIADMNVFANTSKEDVERTLQDAVRPAIAETKTEQTRGPPAKGKASREVNNEYNERETRVHGELANNRQTLSARADGQGSGGKNSGRAEGQVRYGDLTEAERGRLTRFLLLPLDNNKEWDAIIRDATIDEATRNIYNAIARGSSVIKILEAEVPGFAEGVERAEVYLQSRSANIGATAKENNRIALEHFGRTYKWADTGTFS